MTWPAPTIETERLVLRGHRLDDFTDHMSLWQDPLVTRFIGGRPFTAEECWTRFHRFAGHWAMMDFGYWLVRERETGALVGEIGFHDMKREIVPPFGDAPEAGWVLAPAMQGRGFATEALEAAHRWGEEQWGPRRTVCMISPENAASLRVATRTGYKVYARTEYKGSLVLLLERRPI